MLAAAQRYEEREPGLGAQFRETCDWAFDPIAEGPGQHPGVGKGLHWYLFPKFPLAKIYETSAGLLIIVRVFHGCAQPEELAQAN